MQQTTDMWNSVAESQKHYAKWNKSTSKDYIL